MQRIFSFFLLLLPLSLHAIKTDSIALLPFKEQRDSTPFFIRQLSTIDSITYTKIFAYNNPERSPKRPWRAALEATGINLGVHLFDRFILSEEFARSTPKTIWKNIKNGFVWDNDKFSTNLFAHPYHGSLYFNSARSNGLNFLESIPYSLGGSIMWEVAGEIEPPAMNDLIATTIGGIAIGEISHRLSNLVYDDRTRGGRRFLREAVGTLINPIGGFNRLIDGRAWKVQNEYYRYHDYERFPVHFTFSTGMRYLADNGALFRGETNPYIDLDIIYGNPFNTEEKQPYDYFTANLTFGLTGNQPLINRVHILGKLWSKNIPTGSDLQLTAGLFQYFNYYDSEPVIKGSKEIPFRISEAASLGPGVLYRYPPTGGLKRLEQHIFLGAILLGGSLSDYYNVIDRDYNLGFGYSVKIHTFLEFQKYARFNFNVDYLYLATRKGYEGKDLTLLDPLYLNVQGDRSVARLLVISPAAYIRLTSNLDLHLSATGYFRQTNYRAHPQVSAQTFGMQLGVSYRL